VFLRTGLAATALGGAALAQTTGGTGGTGTGGTGTGGTGNGTGVTITPAPPGSFLNAGGNAILRFSLAAEMIAADIWSQIADQIANDTTFAGSLGSLDPFLRQVIHDIARDEQSHANFLAAYAGYAHQDVLNLDVYRTMPTQAPVGAGTGGTVFFGTGTGTQSGRAPEPAIFPSAVSPT